MLRIGKVAAATALSTDALRYYEREGLLAPEGKTPAGYRLYSEDTIRRVQFIRQAQQCGFTLSEIRTLLELTHRDSACCSDVRSVAIAKKLQLEAKIEALRTMSRALDEVITMCVDNELPLKSCPILSALENGIVWQR